MWLVTKFGFYSLKACGHGRIAVRGHVRHDLENLAGDKAIESIAGTGEYAYQILLPEEDVATLIAAAGIRVRRPIN